MPESKLVQNIPEAPRNRALGIDAGGGPQAPRDAVAHWRSRDRRSGNELAVRLDGDGSLASRLRHSQCGRNQAARGDSRMGCGGADAPSTRIAISINTRHVNFKHHNFLTFHQGRNLAGLESRPINRIVAAVNEYQAMQSSNFSKRLI